MLKLILARLNSPDVEHYGNTYDIIKLWLCMQNKLFSHQMFFADENKMTDMLDDKQYDKLCTVL